MLGSEARSLLGRGVRRVEHLDDLDFQVLGLGLRRVTTIRHSVLVDEELYMLKQGHGERGVRSEECGASTTAAWIVPCMLITRPRSRDLFNLNGGLSHALSATYLLKVPADVSWIVLLEKGVDGVFVGAVNFDLCVRACVRGRSCQGQANH